MTQSQKKVWRVYSKFENLNSVEKIFATYSPTKKLVLLQSLVGAYLSRDATSFSRLFAELRYLCPDEKCSKKLQLPCYFSEDLSTKQNELCHKLGADLVI